MKALTMSVYLLGFAIWLAVGAYVAVVSEAEYREIFAAAIERSVNTEIAALE